jgi:hypothetical protein
MLFTTLLFTNQIIGLLLTVIYVILWRSSLFAVKVFSAIQLFVIKVFTNKKAGSLFQLLVTEII